MEALSNEACFNRCSSLPSFPPVCYSFVIVPPSPLSAFMSQASFYPSWLLLYLLLIYFYLFIHLPSSNIPPPFFCLFCTTFTDMYIHICVPYKLEWVRKWEFCLLELESPCLLLTLQIHPFFYKFHFCLQLNKFTLYKCPTLLSSFFCVDEHLGWLQFLLSVNMICESQDIRSFGYVPRAVIATSYVRNFYFSLLRKWLLILIFIIQ